MATTNGNRKLLDLKRWELCSSPLSNNSATSQALYAGMAGVRHIRPMIYFFGGQASAGQDQLYEVLEDGWQLLKTRTIASTENQGSSVVGHYWSTGSTVGAASLTATAGTTSTITTNQTLVRDLRGWPIHIMSGPNAGATLTIVSNTIGANSVITVATQASAFSASTTYRLMTPRWYLLPSYSTPTFSVYDWATNTNTALSTTNLPATQSGWASFVVTPSWRDSNYVSFATGTATSATSTTLVNSAKTWTTNQWTNSQVRIVSGTGAGQIRTISSNTATTLTVPTWTTTPDSTSVYSIEGNDDFIYFVSGSNSANMYKYSISSNTWTASNGAVNISQGSVLVWPFAVSDSTFTNESAILNGRYIYYSNANAGSPSLYQYDITTGLSATIVSGYTHSLVLNKCSAVYHKDTIYFSQANSGNVSHIVAYNLITRDFYGVARTPITPGANNLQHNGMFVATYTDGATSIDFLYWLTAVTDYYYWPMYRMMLF